MEGEREEEREFEREEIYSYLKCKICDGYFENAKILTECLHSFCLVCISQSAECLTQENHFSIACELCNTITTTPSLSLLPSNSISQKLLLNFKAPNKQLEKLETILSNQHNNNNNTINCDNENCKEENKKASLYCAICESNYCEICWKELHSIGTLKKHSPLLIHQKDNIKYCSTHLNKQIDFYCVPCDQLLCSLCLIEEHQNNINNINEVHEVISMEKASEKMKEEFISRSDLIISNRKIIDDRMEENKTKIEEIEIRISSLHHEIEKLEIEKEIMTNKIKEDEEISTQIEISNRMIKDMIQSLPCILTVQKKYRDQIDHQISRVFESLYSFPLPQRKNNLYDDLCSLNEQSFVGEDENSFKLSNDGKKFIKKKIGHCGITVKKGISSGKYRWKILYDNPIIRGWILIGIQLNKPICSSFNSYLEKETFGIQITNGNNESSGNYWIEGKSVKPKVSNLSAKMGEELVVIVDCEKGIFQMISSSFNHSISIPILKQNEKYYLHFDPSSASFSLLSVDKLL